MWPALFGVPVVWEGFWGNGGDLSLPNHCIEKEQPEEYLQQNQFAGEWE